MSLQKMFRAIYDSGGNEQIKMVERTTYRKCLKVGYIKSIVNPAVLQKDKN
jgi:hypothetical protein